MFERQIAIATHAGAMNTFVCHPERNSPHPVIILFMDAPGIREELRDMARRLATVGYYVLLPNLYYRSNVEEVGSMEPSALAATRARAMQLMTTLDTAMIMQDTAALLSFVETDPFASAGAVGCVGYCMSGRFAINAAVCYPRRVRAAASIYGVGLVTDQPDSPHLAPQRTDATLYFGCAESDHYVPPEMVDALRAHLATSSEHVEIETYAGTEHGFAFPQRAVYNKAAAERHWERLFALFGTALA